MINIERLFKSKRVEVRTLNVDDVTGDFVKKFREQRKFSQTVMANMLGVSKKSIEKWEQGTNKIGGSSKVLLKLLHENPELIEKVYSVKVYNEGEKAIEFKTMECDELVQNSKEQAYILVGTPVFNGVPVHGGGIV